MSLLTKAKKIFHDFNVVDILVTYISIPFLHIAKKKLGKANADVNRGEVMVFTETLYGDFCGMGDHVSSFLNYNQNSKTKRVKNICIITPSKSRIQASGIEIIHLPFTGCSALREIRKIVKTRRPYLFHYHYSATAFQKRFWPALIPFVVKSANSGITIWTTFHQFYEDLIPRIFFRLRLTLVYHFSDTNFFFRADQREMIFFQKFYKAPVIIPVGANLEILRNAHEERINQHSDNKYADCFVFFGQIRKGNGLEFLLNSFLGLNYRLVIAGTIKDEGYFTYLKNLNNKVEWIFSPDNDRVFQILSKCRAVILPYEDGLSEFRSTFMSSIYSGAIIITKQSGKTPEHLKKTSGIFIIDDSSVSLKEVLSTVMSLSDHDVAVMKKNVKQVYNTKYNWDIITSRMSYSKLKYRYS